MEEKLGFPHLNERVVKGIKGFNLCSFLVAYEGWRRGLNLRWYHEESAECKLSRLNSSILGNFFSLDDGKNKHYFYRSRGDKVSNSAVLLVQDKNKTKKQLKENDVSIPLGEEFDINSEEKIIEYAESIGYPVVIKPVNGSMGKGVFVNIQNSQQLSKIIKHYHENIRYKNILLEKYYQGKEYRFYVVGDKVVSAINRIPANIIGDGKNTIEELIRLKNIERKKNPYLASKPIKVDYEIEQLLKKQSVDLNYVPKCNEQIILRELSNLSAGGDPIDCTSEISDEIKQLAVDGLKALPDIPHAGVDIIIDSEDPTKGIILEVNATAEIAFHAFPLAGKLHDVPAAIIDYYFPNSVQNEKSKFFFDYKSLLVPLKSLSANFIETYPAPMGKLEGVRFDVIGELNKVGYMKWIRRQALIDGHHGYVKKMADDKMSVFVYGTDLERLKQFYEKCKKGSKRSKVENVEMKVLNVNENKHIQVGFRIYSGKKSK